MVKASDNEFPSVLFDEQAGDPSTPASGFWRVYFKSTGIFLIDDAGAVTGPLGSATPGITMLSDQTVTGSPAANIDFTSISGSYKHLQLWVQARGDDAAAFVLLGLRFNNDSSAIYDMQRSGATNATAGNAGLAAQTFGRSGVITAAGSSATNNAGSTIINIPNYAGTVFNKMAHSSGGWMQTTTNTGFNVESNHVLWRSTAAITRITLLPSAGNFIIGSRATLYGIS